MIEEEVIQYFARDCGGLQMTPLSIYLLHPGADYIPCKLKVRMNQVGFRRQQSRH